MGDNFSKIRIGEYFTASDGEKYKKTSELTYDDNVGFEHYIDPFFDKKIGAPETPVTPAVDTSARVVKSSDEVPKPKKPRKSKKSAQ